MNYEDFANKTRSRKFILAHLGSLRQFKVFEAHSETEHKKQVNYFCNGVIVDGEELSQGQLPLNENEFYYDITSNVVYLRLSGDEDPKTKTVFFKFIHFFSNFAQNLPHDLDEGEEVYYSPNINKIGDLKLELDYENTGIAIESDSSVTLVNESMIDIFDTHIWENQPAFLYSWGQDLKPNQAKLIYRGIINNKSYNSREVTFNFKDELAKLKETISMPRFSDLDGSISQDVLNKPKRLVFGKCKQLRTTGIDKTLSGYKLTGLISGSADRNLLSGSVSGNSGSSIINGIGTQFLSQISPNQKIRIIFGIFEYSYTVDTVSSNTSLTVTETISASFSNAQARNEDVLNNIITGSGTDFINELSYGDIIKVSVLGRNYEYTVETISSQTELIIEDNIQAGFTDIESIAESEVPYRRKNRKWSVAGHKLYEFDTLISTVLSPNSFNVEDVGDIEEGDYLLIDNLIYTVFRVSFLTITLNQALPVTVTAGFEVKKIPIGVCFLNSTQFVFNRDFSVINTDEAIIEFNDLAEFNVAQITNPSLNMQFINGSNVVTNLTSTVDLANIYKTRDWIKVFRADSPTWYEVIGVTQTTLILRQSYSGTNYTGQIQSKSPNYINDESLITCDALGIVDENEWIRFPSQAVKYVIKKIGITNIDDQSFLDSKESCEMELSLFYPFDIGSEIPDSRQIITDINSSVFGSLYINPNFEFSYSILNAEKPESLEIFDDSDIINYSITTRNNIYSEIIMQYRPFTDFFTGSDIFNQINLESEIVNNSSKIKRTLQVKSYLYNYEDALTIAQRWLFFRSLTQTVVTINSKLNLATKSLNDKISLKLDKLFRRYGSSSNIKIGIINYISKSDVSTQVRFNDLGNVFNRVGAISPDSQVEYLSSSEHDVAKYCFIVDNELETPDSTENELGTNLIG